MIDFENLPLIKMFSDKVRAETRQEAYIDVLLQIINQEFGKRGVEELEPHIRAIANGEKLASLITPALQSPSVEAFKKTLDGA